MVKISAAKAEALLAKWSAGPGCVCRLPTLNDIMWMDSRLVPGSHCCICKDRHTKLSFFGRSNWALCDSCLRAAGLKW